MKSRTFCDKRMSVKLKGKVNNGAVVIPAMYSLETVPMKNRSEKKMLVAEMRMLRWVSGVTRKDAIKEGSHKRYSEGNRCKSEGAVLMVLVML